MVATRGEEWSRIIKWLSQISDVATGFRDLVCRAFFTLTHLVSFLFLSCVFVRKQRLTWSIVRTDLGWKTAVIL